jgi:TolB-like protein
VVSSRSNASASRVFLAGLCAFALALSLGARPADAAKKKKVVVLDFKGPKAAPIQKKVVAALKKSATVINQAKFTAASKKVKGFKANAAGVSKVAKKLKAHAVVSGKVSKKKKKYKLTIQVREGRSGDYVGDDIVVTMKAGKLTAAQEKKIARELKAAIEDLPSPGKPVAEEEEEEPVAEEDGGGGGGGGGGEEEAAPKEDEDEVRVAGADDGEKEEPAAEEEDKGAGDDEEKDDKEDKEEEDKDKDDDDDDDEKSVSKSAKLSSAQQADMDARGRAVDVSAGLSFQSRALTFAHDGDLVNTPQGYDGAMVPGLYVLGEVYPMALVDKKTTGFTRHIGLTFMIDKVLLIKSKPAGMDVDLPTSQTRFGIGLVYRWNFGTTPTSPTLKIGAKYNKLSFTIDESAAPTAMVEIPDVSYTYIDPGVAFRYPITEKIAANAEAHYLIVSKAGQISEATQYGASKVSGFDVDLGGEYKLSSSLLVRAGFRLSKISLKFSGDTGDLKNRDADAEADVQSASDRYLGIYATAGYLF